MTSSVGYHGYMTAFCDVYLKQHHDMSTARLTVLLSVTGLLAITGANSDRCTSNGQVLDSPC